MFRGFCELHQSRGNRLIKIRGKTSVDGVFSFVADCRVLSIGKFFIIKKANIVEKFKQNMKINFLDCFENEL